MRMIGRHFMLGITILLPAILSIQLVVWLVSTMERWLKPLWLLLLPNQFYFPGLAALTFVGIVVAVGISARLPIADRLWRMPGRVLERLPVVAFIYNMIRDFVDLMGGKNFEDQSVVSASLPGVNGRLLGIVTRRSSDKGSTLGDVMEDKEVAVYFPMSYQAGGYMVFLPESELTDVDMTPGEALSLIMTAGLGQSKQVK